jgi:hypothetical protein
VPSGVLQPTLLDKRFTWLVGLPQGGWLAQLQVVHRAAWHTESTLPRLEDLVGPADDAAADVTRVSLLLADDGMPRAALVAGTALWLERAETDPRVPMLREGAWDATLPPGRDGVARTLLLQRIALPDQTDPTHLGRAWTHAGYAVWQVDKDAVRPVVLPLAPLTEEGVWDCDAEPPVTRLTCQFRRLGAKSEATAEKRVFVLEPGAVASFRLVAPGDRSAPDGP